MLGDLRAPAGSHPGVDRARVVDHLAHVRVEAEDAVGQAERLHGVAHGAHAAHEIGPATADDDEERRRAVLAEVLAERIRHSAECLEDIGIVGLAADDEQHVRLLEPVLEADLGNRLHLRVRRIAAEVRRDDRVFAEQLGHQRVGAAAEGGR